MINVDLLSNYELVLTLKHIVGKNLNWIKYDNSFSSRFGKFDYIRIERPRTGDPLYLVGCNLWDLIPKGDDRWKQHDELCKSLKTKHNDSTGDVRCGLNTDYRVDNIEFSSYSKSVRDIIEFMYNLNPRSFEEQFNKLKIPALAKQKESLREQNKKRSLQKRSNEFTVYDQKFIAELVLASLQKNNYLLRLANGDLNKEDVDRSGKSLFDSLRLFNINKDAFLSAILRTYHRNGFDKTRAAAARRFALTFSEDNKDIALGITDDDNLVRELARQKKQRKDIVG